MGGMLQRKFDAHVETCRDCRRHNVGGYQMPCGPRTFVEPCRLPKFWNLQYMSYIRLTGCHVPRFTYLDFS